MEKKLKEHTIAEFVAVLAWPGGAPGGGSMCALAGALGVSGLILVAKLTAGLKRFAEQASLCNEIAQEAQPLMRALIDGIDRDTDCYNELVAAYRLPKGDVEELATRKTAIAKATLSATEAPYDVLRLALEGIRLCDRLAEHYNPAAASDFGAAVLQLNAAAKTAWHNILANLGGIADSKKADEIACHGRAMHDEAAATAQKLIAFAEGQLGA